MPKRFSFLSFVLTACAFLCVQPLQAQMPETERRNPGRGVRVIEVAPGGQAERAGIQVMDLLSKYGKFTVVDHSSYYKAREFYLKTPDVKVKVEFWRGHTRIVIEVFPGTIGMDTNEYGLVAYQLDSAMMHVNALMPIPEFNRMVEFKDVFEKGGLPAAIAKANEIIDRGEAEGALTATQVLVGRIGLILDDAPEEELKKLDALLAEFIRGQPAEYIGYLGEKFREKEHFRPAKELLKHYLLTDPDNVSIRLNLGYVCSSLGLWTEAEAAADLVLTHPEDLSPHGFVVAYQQKALGALHRGDYDTSISFATKGFEIERGTFELSVVQLAAALSGNVTKFNEVSARYKEADPDNYESLKLKTDSAEALALSISGQDELARAVIARWAQKDRIEGRLRNYWRFYPHGNRVVENWLRLAQQK